jgi:hypothetical protein
MLGLSIPFIADLKLKYYAHFNMLNQKTQNLELQ